MALSQETLEDRQLLDKAQEIVELFQTAIKLGYSIALSPEQMRTLIAICECAYLVKPERNSNG